jgi:hypothetical protein
MLNGEQIVAQVKSGHIDPGWVIFASQRGFFVRYVLLGLFLLALAIVGGIILSTNPNTAFIPTSIGDSSATGTLDPTSFDRWRLVDVIGVVLVGGIGVAAMIRYAIDFARSQAMQLIVTPTGVVVQTPSLKTFAFADVQQAPKFTAYRSQVTITWIMKNGQKQRLVLDGRYGSPRRVADAIVRAWGQASSQHA